MDRNELLKGKYQTVFHEHEQIVEKVNIKLYFMDKNTLLKR